jgi:type IV pilus assembly protein PilA
MTLQRFRRKVRGDQNGFTLLEMIVVVGIVSLLAAVIVPNIGKFIGSGDQGAKDAEADSVRHAMNAMMSETVVSTVDPWAAPEQSTNLWTDKPTDPSDDALPLGKLDRQYLMATNTQYYYCYNDQGIITQQDKAPSPCPAP